MGYIVDFERVKLFLDKVMSTQLLISHNPLWFNVRIFEFAFLVFIFFLIREHELIFYRFINTKVMLIALETKIFL